LFFIGFLRGLRDLRGKTIITKCLLAIQKHDLSPYPFSEVAVAMHYSYHGRKVNKNIANFQSKYSFNLSRRESGHTSSNKKALTSSFESLLMMSAGSSLNTSILPGIGSFFVFFFSFISFSPLSTSCAKRHSSRHFAMLQTRCALTQIGLFYPWIFEKGSRFILKHNLSCLDNIAIIP